jgi:hypothetical protein
VQSRFLLDWSGAPLVNVTIDIRDVDSEVHVRVIADEVVRAGVLHL